MVLLFVLSYQAHSTDTKELTVAFAHENYDFYQIFEVFTAQTGIKIQPAAFASTELKVELLQRASRNQLPDAVIVPGDYIGLDEIEFSNVPTSWFLNTTGDKNKEAVKLNGQYKGIPIIAGNHLVLYYNKSLVQMPAKSWLQLKQQFGTFGSNIDTINWSYNEMYWFLPFLGAFESMPLVNDKIQLDTNGMQLAMEYYWQLEQQGIVDSSCNYNCAVERFVSSKSAYTINGVWAMSHFKEELGDNLGIALLPTIEGKPLKPYYSVHALTFPKNSASGSKSKELEALSKFLQSYETQRKIWSTLASLPINKQVMEEVLNSEDANIKAVILQLEQAEAMPVSKKMAVVWEVMLKGMNRYKGGVLTLEKTRSYMQYTALKSIAEFNQ